MLATVLAAASSIIYGSVYQTAPVAPGESILTDPAFVATVPYHPLIMLLVWTLTAGVYFWRRGVAVKQVALLSAFWLGLAMVVDYVGFIIIENPWRMTHHEFYVMYQPWISLIYLAIFASPWAWFVLHRNRAAAA